MYPCILIYAKLSYKKKKKMGKNLAVLPKKKYTHSISMYWKGHVLHPQIPATK